MIIDNVLRKQRYVRDHPDVKITHLTAPWWYWKATWADPDGTAREEKNDDLGRLMDRLEEPDGPA